MTDPTQTELDEMAGTIALRMMEVPRRVGMPIMDRLIDTLENIAHVEQQNGDYPACFMVDLHTITTVMKQVQDQYDEMALHRIGNESREKVREHLQHRLMEHRQMVNEANARTKPMARRKK